KADYILYEIYADYLHEILNLVSDNPDNEAKIREVLEQYKNAEREYKNSGEKVNTWLLLSKVYRANQVLIDPKVEKASPSNETNENACDQSGEEINPDLIKDAANTPLLEGDDEELRETDTTNSDEPLIPEISSPLTQTTTISFKPFELPADEKHVPTPITVPKSRTSYSEVLISPKIIKTSKRKSVIESVGVGESGDYIITTPEIPAS
ncbi:22705_t:CDS:2, partial [Racocetra persica]